MKTITHHLEGAAQRAKDALRARAGQTDNAPRPAESNKLRLVQGQANDRPALPDWAPSSHVNISERGRELLSRLAQTAEQGAPEGASDEELGLFVAEGIEDGFLD